MSSFLFIDGGGRIVGADRLYAEAHDQEDAFDFFLELSALADVGMLFFRGLYPIEAPYFAWGKIRELPWVTDFIGEDGETIRDAKAEEVSFVLEEIRSYTVDYEKPQQATYLSALLTASPKLTMQGFAIEMLECVDGLVARLQAKRPSYREANLLAEAYKYLSEMTVEAERILLEEASSQAQGAIERMKHGARKGGLASAETRRQSARVPKPERLKEIRDSMIAAGMPERSVAKALAERFHCTADSIRKAMRNANKGPSSR